MKVVEDYPSLAQGYYESITADDTDRNLPALHKPYTLWGLHTTHQETANKRSLQVTCRMQAEIPKIKGWHIKEFKRVSCPMIRKGYPLRNENQVNRKGLRRYHHSSQAGALPTPSPVLYLQGLEYSLVCNAIFV